MIYKVTLIFLAGLLLTLTVAGQNKAVNFEDLSALQSGNPRPVVVLITTDWCKYCHAMQNTMLRNQKVAGFLSTEFRTVFLNAEEKRNIFFAGKVFNNKSGLNELAVQLGTKNGSVSYPTLCILNTKNEIIFQHDGYLPPQGMLYLLKQVLSAQ